MMSIGAGKTIVVDWRRAELEQRLQVAQLQRDRVLLDHERRVLQPLGGLELALGVDHLRAPLALGLGLAGHRALHALRDLDVLHLDDRDLDPPGRGLLVDDPLQDRVDLLALREQLVERVLAEHRPQRRLRDLGGRDHVVLDLDDRRLRVDDPEVRDRVHAHRDVVLRDHFLRRDVQRDRAQVDLDHLVDDRDQEEEPRPLRLREAAARAGRRSPRSYSRATLIAAIRSRTTQEDDDGDDDQGGGHDSILRHRRRSDRMHPERQAVERLDLDLLARARAARPRAPPELAVDEHEPALARRRPASRRSPRGPTATGRRRRIAIAFEIANAQRTAEHDA